MWSIEMHLINHLHIDIHTVYKKKLCDHKSMHSYKKPLLKKNRINKKKTNRFFDQTYILIRG